MMKRLVRLCSYASQFDLTLAIGQIDSATVKATHFGGFSDDENDPDEV